MKNSIYMLYDQTKFLKKSIKSWSIETTPLGAVKIDDFSKILHRDTTVNVTFLPGSDPMDTVKICKKLFQNGMNPVPHISARAIKNFDDLEDFLRNLHEYAKVKEVLVVAGGKRKPIGDLYNSMQILNSGLLQKYQISKVGVAGHPEGSPDINNDDIAIALENKNIWSEKEGIPVYIETQFAFDAKPVLEWEKNIRIAGNKLHIHAGIPGPATIKTLFQFAKSSGVGNSIKMLTKQAMNITKLLTIQAPDKFIYGLAKGMEEDKNCLIKQFHFYPFGGFNKTAEWVKSIENGSFVLDNLSGFKIKN